jgi:hypothetical protein
MSLSSDVHAQGIVARMGRDAERLDRALARQSAVGVSRCARIVIAGWYGQKILQTEQRDGTETILLAGVHVGITTDDAWDTIVRFQ